MSKTYLQEGDITPVTLAADATVGTLVAAGSIVGVAMETGVSGAVINLHTEGVHLITKKSGTAWTQGVPLYWDATPGELTTVAADGTFAGYAFKAASSGATTGEILLARPGTDAAALSGAELQSNKNNSNGYAGLGAQFSLQLKNALGTVISLFTTAATSIRTWTMPNVDGNVVLNNVAGKWYSGTATLIAGQVVIGIADLPAITTGGANVTAFAGHRGAFAGTETGAIYASYTTNTSVTFTARKVDGSAAACTGTIYWHIFIPAA